MKKHLYSLGLLLSAILIASVAHAQNFTYAISSGPVNLLSKITNVITVLPQGSTIISGDNIAMPWGTTALSTTNYKFTVGTLPGGATNLQWSVRGDLKIVGSSTGTSVEIGQSNITNRFTATDLAQSKGRVYFTYTITGSPCGTISTSFDVFKQFAGTNNSNGTVTNPAVPAIIGPSCILPNTQYTYSVDPIMSDNLSAQIGMDRYFWDISQVGAVASYYSTDSSSITFTTGSTVPNSCTLKCGLGMANYAPLQTVTASQAYATKAIQAGAGAPIVTMSGAVTGTIAAGSPFCLNTNGATATSLTFTAAVQGACSWSYGTTGANGTGSINGWNPSGGIGNVSGNVLTIPNIYNQPGTVTLTVTDACGSFKTYSYEIKRTLRPADVNLVTLGGTCLTPGASTSFSIAANANLNTVAWTGAGFTQGTNTLTANAGIAPGSYSLNASFAGCPSIVPYTVNVKPLAVTITNPCLPRNTNGISVTASPASTTGYSWTTSSGSISGSGNVATLNTLSTSPLAVVATYTVAAGCATGSGNVAFNLLPIVPAVTIPTCLNSAPFTLAVTNYPGYGSYTLQFVSGTNTVTSYSVSGGNINVVPNGLTGTGTYKVIHTNGTCTTAETTVTFGPVAPPFTVSVLYNNDTFAVLGASSYTLNYTWYNCSTNTVLGTTTAPTTTWQLNTPNTTANYYFGAQAVVAGCTTRVCVNVPHFQARLHNSGVTSVTLPAEIGSVYPNPNNGTFIIELKNASEDAAVTVYDMTGSTVYKAKLSQGTNRVNDMPAAAGQYLVVIAANGKFYTQKVTVSKQ